MAVHQQGSPPGIRTGDTDNDIAAPRCTGFHIGRVESDVGQPLGDPFRGRSFDDVRPTITGVGGVDTDEVPGQAQDIIDRRALRHAGAVTEKNVVRRRSWKPLAK